MLVCYAFQSTLSFDEVVKYRWRELPQVSFLSRQTYFCRDKKRVLSRQTRVCRDETFVVTKMILVAAPANDSKALSVAVL